jgi:hypothetical protein
MSKSSLRQLFLASALILSSLASLPSQAQSPSTQSVQGVRETMGAVTIDWSEGVIQVTGTGAPPDRGTASQRRLMAERAAIADAYRQLAEAINGVRVDAETVVKDYITESDTVRIKVGALIRGAQKIDRRFLSDGSIEIDMVLKLYSEEGLSGILQPQKNPAPPPPVPADLKPNPNPGDYTSVIVDCRGLGIQAAMSPALLNQSGGELYLGHLPVDPDFVVNKGIIAYSTSLNEARRHERAGDMPLIVKAIAASGNFHADAVLAEKETQQVLGLEQKNKVLSLSHVIFVL